MRHALSILVGLPFVLTAYPVQAVDMLALFETDLQTLMQIKVVTASQQAQEGDEAPATVSVITRYDIQNFHYRSVAEALNQVPGIYCIYDFLSYNCGVRGINGGLRAYSKNLKVMINSQPVSFRSDSANYLGPELIPMSIVERIEVLRGPASALYGANAYLGVINIITRQAEEEGQTLQAAMQTSMMEDGNGVAGEALYQGKSASTRWLMGLHSARNERAGHALPDSSPRMESYDDRTSRDDVARPASLYGDASFHFLDAHELRTEVHLYELDSHAEFLDFGTLSHENRIVLQQSTLRASDKWRINETWDTELSIAYSQGEPGDEEHLLGDDQTVVPRRVFSFDALDANARVAWQANPDNHISVGLDYSDDNEALIRVFAFDLITGASALVSEDQGDQNFTNRGAYAQWQTQAFEAWQFTFNLRRDRHNLYGSDDTQRAAAVYSVNDDLSFKFLFGTSFKAPAALQLFAQPLIVGEIIGNPELEPERAKTSELGLNWIASTELTLAANLFHTQVDEKVELSPAGINQQFRNIGEQKSRGVEFEMKWVRDRHWLTWNTSYQHTDTTIHDPFVGEIETPSVMYPQWLNQFSWQYRDADLADLFVRGRYASQRRSTDSNTLYNNLKPYDLDPYMVLDAGVSKRFSELDVYFVINNLLNEEYEEPGFVGVDIPGRTQEYRLGVQFSWD